MNTTQSMNRSTGAVLIGKKPGPSSPDHKRPSNERKITVQVEQETVQERSILRTETLAVREPVTSGSGDLLFASIYLILVHLMATIVFVPSLMKSLSVFDQRLLLVLTGLIWCLITSTIYGVWKSRQWSRTIVHTLITTDVSLGILAFTAGQVRLAWQIQPIILVVVAGITTWALRELHRVSHRP